MTSDMSYFEKGVRFSLEADVRQIVLDRATEPVHPAAAASVGESHRKAQVCFFMDRRGEVPVSPGVDMARIYELRAPLGRVAAA
jgi:hypothetical protein